MFSGVDSADTDVYVSHITPKKQAAIAKLVGRKCSIRCLINDADVEALWDTGAQVSIIPEHVLSDKLPKLKIRDISELLGVDSGLNLTAANGTSIPYKGWIEIKFRLNREDEKEVTVSFLVTPEQLQQPIIGYNVIELFVQSEDNNSLGSSTTVQSITASFNNVGEENAEQLVNLIYSKDEGFLCPVIHVQYLCTIFNGQTKCPMDIFLSIGPIAYWNIKWTLEGVHWVFWIHWIQWSTAMSNGHLNVKWPCWPRYPGH